MTGAGIAAKTAVVRGHAQARGTRPGPGPNGQRFGSWARTQRFQSKNVSWGRTSQRLRMPCSVEVSADASVEGSGASGTSSSTGGYFLYKFDQDGEITEVVDSSSGTARASPALADEPATSGAAAEGPASVPQTFHEGLEPEELVKEAVQPSMEKVTESLRPKVPEFHEGMSPEGLVKEAVQENLDRQTRDSRPKVPKMDEAIGSAESQVKAAVQENLDKQVKATRPKVPKLHPTLSAEQMVKDSVQATLDKLPKPRPASGKLPTEGAQDALADDEEADAALPALSRMRKAELVAECDERGVSSEGTVSDLRARLREARDAAGV